MGRFTDYLVRALPRTGRAIREDGTAYNTADGLLLRNRSQPATASRMGDMYRGYIEDTIPASATHEYVIDIPDGIDVFGFVRLSEVVDGSARTAFLTCSGFTSAAGPIAGLNFDRRATNIDKRTGQATLHRATTGSLTDVVQHSPSSLLYAPSTGSTRAPSVQTEEGMEPAFDSTALPAFRYVNQQGADLDMRLYVFWQELTN